MYGTKWRTSPRRFEVVVERDVAIPLSTGDELVGDLFRPDTDKPVPVVAGFHPYNNEFQTAPITPEGFSLQRGWMESGDPYFLARRGYAHGLFNVRGTGKSTGSYQAMGPREAADVAEAVEWFAEQEWSTTSVGLFGISYFAWLQLQVAQLAPPSLKAIFAPFGATDFYRDFLYHGGILSYRFLLGWKDKLDGLRYQSWYEARHGRAAFEQALEAALGDEEIAAVPGLVAALSHPTGANALVADVVLSPFDDDFWAERRVSYAETSVPAYLGACWGLNGLHLPAAFRSFARWRGPSRLLVGPDVYLDRPFYQLQYEAVRFFDHFLCGNDTGLMDEPRVTVFVGRTGRWRRSDSWPLPETRWTPFYLQEGAALSEREPPSDMTASTSFEDSPFLHGGATFTTPRFVEETEILGPASLIAYVSTTDTDALVFASLFAIDRDGDEHELARGWLRASQAELDTEHSTEIAPRHLHRRRSPLVPGSVNRLEVEINGVSARFEPGERLGLRVKLADDEQPPDALRATSFGHVWRQTASRCTIHHDDRHPSALFLPVTDGNLLGTFLSGGELPARNGPIPTAKITRVKRPG